MSDYTHETFTDGDYRARIVLDLYPSAPEFEAGCPVIRLESTGGYGWLAEETGYGEASWRGDGLDLSITSVIEDLTGTHGADKGLEILERWLKVFHAGQLAVLERPGFRDYGYLAYTTGRMIRDVWGCTDPSAVQVEGDEWMAYVRGDVYGIVIERRVTVETATFTDDTETAFAVSEDWQEVESVWGFYGDGYAEDEARAMLADYVQAGAA